MLFYNSLLWFLPLSLVFPIATYTIAILEELLRPIYFFFSEMVLCNSQLEFSYAWDQHETLPGKLSLQKLKSTVSKCNFLLQIVEGTSLSS